MKGAVLSAVQGSHNNRGSQHDEYGHKVGLQGTLPCQHQVASNAGSCADMCACKIHRTIFCSACGKMIDVVAITQDAYSLP